MSKAPSRSQDQFIVRLPDGMRDRIKRAADSNNRSMNAEIVATLIEKYPEHDGLALLQQLLAEWGKPPKDRRTEAQTRGFVEWAEGLVKAQDSKIVVEYVAPGKVRLKLGHDPGLTIE